MATVPCCSFLATVCHSGVTSFGVSDLAVAGFSSFGLSSFGFSSTGFSVSSKFAGFELEIPLI